jgi:hypothetical protein
LAHPSSSSLLLTLVTIKQGNRLRETTNLGLRNSDNAIRAAIY